MQKKGTFQKGNTPWNKGVKGIHLSPKSEFKAGPTHTGACHPSWKGGVQKPKADCAYLWTSTKTRARRPRVIYEQHHGSIPKGYVIRHIDGNKDNDHIDNLQAISRAENMKLNSNR
tara:strand:- start:769 stop:1116 length:348 start_codon:yes stop_codon:yes gene_type:complete